MSKKIVYSEGIPYQEDDPSKTGITVDERKTSTDSEANTSERVKRASKKTRDYVTCRWNKLFQQ